MEAEKLADGVAEYVKNGTLPECRIAVKAAPGINRTVPMKISGTRDVNFSMRVGKKIENILFSYVCYVWLYGVYVLLLL